MRDLLAEDGTSPGEVLRRLNRSLVRDLPASRFVTMVYGVLDPARRRLTFANAGHPYPLLVDRQGGRFLETETGLPLGIQDGAFAEREVELRAESRLVLYSDGVSEATSPSGEEYGMARIASASATLETLLGSVNDFLAGAPASDDQTVVILRAG